MKLICARTNKRRKRKGKKTDPIRLGNCLVPMQCTGNSGCFPRGKPAAIVRRLPVGFFYVCIFFSFLSFFLLLQVVSQIHFVCFNLSTIQCHFVFCAIKCLGLIMKWGRMPGGERRRTRQRSTIYLQKDEAGPPCCQSDQRYNFLKSDIGKAFERRDGAHMGFPECLATTLY